MKKLLALLGLLLVMTSCGNNTTTQSTTTNSDKPATNAPAKEDDKKAVGFKDGTFKTSAKGMKSDIELEVVVAEGKIKEIKVVKQDETPELFEKAKAVINSIIEKQSTEVDTVATATVSSKAIIEAVSKVLEKK